MSHLLISSYYDHKLMTLQQLAGWSANSGCRWAALLSPS